MRYLFLIPLVLIAAYRASAQTEPIPKPDFVLQGSVTHADETHYRMLPFQVPAGVQRITVELDYTEHEKHTAIDLGLFDPARFRGWSGGNKSSFTVSETDATPSYLSGPLPEGTWHLLLGIASIREGVQANYTAKIYFSRLSAKPDVFSSFSSTVRPGAAWYRGDLHMHTAHSDGSCKSQSGRSVPCPLFKTLEAASQRGLDFIAVSDHNTTSHYEAERELAPYFDKLLLMHAREITTYEGHANLFGTDQFVDFRLGTPEVPNINSLLQKAHDTGGLLSINHPGRPTGEQCIGCGWSPKPAADMHLVQAIEAINGKDADTPVSGIPFWEEQLNHGFHITGIGDSDSHHADTPLDRFGSVGHPTTVVYAAELSEAAILNGIRAGHVFVDAEGSSDRSLSLTAKTGAQTAMMGDSLAVPPGAAVNFSVDFSHIPVAQIEVIEDGKILQTFASVQENQKQEFSVQEDGKPHWVRVNIRSTSHELLLLGNPIYLEPAR
jgi:hypothetical protein